MSADDRPKIHDPRKYWLDEPANVKKVIIALVVLCVVLFAADAVYHKHSHFAAEDWFGFYGLFGFVMCIGLVMVSKVMRIFLMRDEEYYDRNE